MPETINRNEAIAILGVALGNAEHDRDKARSLVEQVEESKARALRQGDILHALNLDVDLAKVRADVHSYGIGAASFGQVAFHLGIEDEVNKRARGES